MAQSIFIVGPNLRDQSKGQFVIHAAGCRDLQRLARSEPEVRNGWGFDGESLHEIVTEVYADIMDENEGTVWAEPNAYMDDFHFAPCVKLPVSS